MKIIYRISIILIIIVSFSACTRKKEKFFHITYKLTFLSENTHPVFIGYKDSTDYVTLYTTENWSKEVLLPHDALTSLLVIPSIDFRVANDGNTVVISGQIIHKDKAITSYGESIAITSFVSDI